MKLNEFETARLFGFIGLAMGSLECVEVSKGNVNLDGIKKIREEIEDLADFLMDKLQRDDSKS